MNQDSIVRLNLPGNSVIQIGIMRGCVRLLFLLVLVPMLVLLLALPMSPYTGSILPLPQALSIRQALAYGQEATATKDEMQSRITALFIKTEELKRNDVEKSVPDQITLLQSWLLQAQASLTASEYEDVDRLLRRCDFQVQFIEASIASATAQKALEQMEGGLKSLHSDIKKHQVDIIRLSSEKQALKLQEMELMATGSAIVSGPAHVPTDSSQSDLATSTNPENSPDGDKGAGVGTGGGTGADTSKGTGKNTDSAQNNTFDMANGGNGAP